MSSANVIPRTEIVPSPRERFPASWDYKSASNNQFVKIWPEDSIELNPFDGDYVASAFKESRGRLKPQSSEEWLQRKADNNKHKRVRVYRSPEARDADNDDCNENDADGDGDGDADVQGGSAAPPTTTTEVAAAASDANQEQDTTAAAVGLNTPAGDNPGATTGDGVVDTQPRREPSPFREGDGDGDGVQSSARRRLAIYEAQKARIRARENACWCARTFCCFNGCCGCGRG